MAEEGDGSPLFAVFFLSLLSLVLIPWTLYKCCSKSQESLQSWAPVRVRHSARNRQCTGCDGAGRICFDAIVGSSQ